MSRDLSFAKVLEYAETKDDNEVLSVLKPIAAVLTGLAAVQAGLPIDLAAVGPVLDLASPLVDLASEAIKKFAPTTRHCADRWRRMEGAFVSLTYAAFFEALDAALPAMMKQLKLKPDEKLQLAAGASKNIDRGSGNPLQRDVDSQRYVIRLPRPGATFAPETMGLVELYENLTASFLQLLTSLVIWEDAGADVRHAVMQEVRGLPAAAVGQFDVGYLELSRSIPEFGIWAGYYDKRSQFENATRDSAEARAFFQQLLGQTRDLGTGLKQLQTAFARSQEARPKSGNDAILQQLQKRYDARVQEPIAHDTLLPGEESIALTFPTALRIYIPQAYRLMERASGTRLASDASWDPETVHQDLQAFLYQYLLSPHSGDTPLLVLGNPGSGKSLFTEVLAARLGHSKYLPIRVELRSVNASSTIQDQIEEAVRQLSGEETNWVDLVGRHAEMNPVIILDGYDELLQASGKIFADYLQRVSEFQNREMELGRAVRVIVTSRMTLLDKVTIPKGLTTLRLEPFDESRQRTWVKTWNDVNAAYFPASGVVPFALPRDPTLDPLAEQPLLLLMLAIHDSAANAVSQGQGIGRAQLYDQIIRRFVLRQRRKLPSFRELDDQGKADVVEKDVLRLGVAAVGMMSRRRLSIRSDELDADIQALGMEWLERPGQGRLMSESETIIGSYFFVQQSQSRGADSDGGYGSGEAVAEIVFEFLHNTIGDFLAADFLTEQILDETGHVAGIRLSARMPGQLERRVADTSFGAAWHACLAYTPLTSKPVVLSMLREWLPEKVSRARRDLATVLDDLKLCINTQIAHVLYGRLEPGVAKSSGNAGYAPLPLSAHLATYSQNLIVLMTVVSAEGHHFGHVGSGVDVGHTDPWTRLSALWRSWFGMEDLAGLASLFSAERDDKGDVVIHYTEQGRHGAGSGNLDRIAAVAESLADSHIVGLTAVVRYVNVPRHGAFPTVSEAVRRAGLDVGLFLAQEGFRTVRFKRHADAIQALEAWFEVVQERDQWTPRLFLRLLEAATDVPHGAMTDHLIRVILPRWMRSGLWDSHAIEHVLDGIMRLQVPGFRWRTSFDAWWDWSPEHLRELAEEAPRVVAKLLVAMPPESRSGVAAALGPDQRRVFSIETLSRMRTADAYRFLDAATGVIGPDEREWLAREFVTRVDRLPLKRRDPDALSWLGIAWYCNSPEQMIKVIEGLEPLERHLRLSDELDVAVAASIALPDLPRRRRTVVSLLDDIDPATIRWDALSLQWVRRLALSDGRVLPRLRDAAAAALVEG